MSLGHWLNVCFKIHWSALQGPNMKTLVVILIALSTRIAQCLLCDNDKDCFGDYRVCCVGYCKKSCNATCLLSSDCGSLGHLHEKCCNNKCVDIDKVCPQMITKKTQLTSTHIAVLVVCVVVFVLVGACALVMYIFKCGFFNRRRRGPDNPRPPRQIVFPRWKPRSFVRCLRRDDDYLNTNICTSTSESWVGRDFIQSNNPVYTNRSTDFRGIQRLW